jgi:hypothetical protein
MATETKKNQVLKGRENYLPWITRLEALLTLDDVIKRNTDTDKLETIGSTTAAKNENEKKAKKYVISNCDDKVMHSINPSDNFVKIIEKLNGTYGFGHMDPAIILAEIREMKFHPSKDPSVLLNEIDIKLAQLESAGGTITDLQVVQYMHDGLSGDPLRDSFWFNCKGAMNMAKLSSYSVESAGKYIVQFWYSYKPNKHYETANKASYEKRFCQKCKDGKRFKIMKTHNTNDCRIGVKDKEVAVETDNKEASNYSFFHDSGTSKTMVNFKPLKNHEKVSTNIYTAGAGQPPEIGVSTGQVDFKSIPLNVLEVPTFSKNLLSATQLSIEHGCKQVISPWTAKLTISKEGKTIATGTYDKKEKLIRIDDNVADSAQSLRATPDSWTTIHRKLGHVGSKLITNTIKSSSGIELSPNKFAALDCSECLLSKAKRGPIPKGNKIEKEILDVIELDVQGPFPIVASDGTQSNLKLIDCASDWLYYTTLNNTRSNTILQHFMTFKTRLEKQTGRSIKRVRTDGGNEFMGEFLAYLELSGIIKEKGVAYTHHHPGKVERCHQTILRLARAMLKDSKLPPKYYNEAQRCATYLFNRMPHGQNAKSPYERIFNRKPDLKHLRPFGTVCYAFVPPETRNKLEDSGLKCRLLGYGDDFETEEINGYRLLREDDLSIIFCDNVTFDKDFKTERLHEDCYCEEDEKLSDTLWEPFDQETSSSDTDGYETAEDESLNMSEMSNLVQTLNQENWWKQSHDMEYALMAVTDGTPVNYKQAMKSKDAKHWKAAMDVEMNNIRRNDTYKLKKIKHGERAIGCRWVFKLKLNSDGTVNKYKARLVAKGYLQKHGKDFNETFAPVAKYKSIRLLLALAASKGWSVYHDDATSAFLNGVLKEKVFMEQPEGYEELTDEYKWELLKALYGLKQAPREWHEVLHNFLISKEFKQCIGDPCIYVRRKTGSVELIGIYVDDILSTGSNIAVVEDFRSELKSKFKCSEGGLVDWCLGMEVTQHSGGIDLNQNQYVKQKLEEFSHILDNNTKRRTPLDPNFQELLINADQSSEVELDFPYRSIVGSLMYAATGTRPDIMTAVGVVSRFSSSPKKIHCDMVRQILYYLRQHPTYSLTYKRNSDITVRGYSDSSWANNEDSTSISGFIFLLGDSLITWSSKKQPVVALSSTEAEYVSVTSASQEALWLKSLLEELGFNQECIKIYEDNEACINLSKNPQEFKRTRHIQVKYHFIRSHVKDQNIKLVYVPTKDQLADFLTKGVSGPRLSELLKKIGVHQTIQHEGELEMHSSLLTGLKVDRSIFGVDVSTVNVEE